MLIALTIILAKVTDQWDPWLSQKPRRQKLVNGVLGPHLPRQPRRSNSGDHRRRWPRLPKDAQNNFPEPPLDSKPNRDSASSK
jgi:hypothetical protein